MDVDKKPAAPGRGGKGGRGKKEKATPPNPEDLDKDLDTYMASAPADAAVVATEAAPLEA